MCKDNVISLKNPEGNTAALTSLLRSGARELITKAVQSELAEFLSQYQDVTDSEGRPLVVHNGYLPQREIMTGIGPVDIKVPKTRDRGRQDIHFRSELLPPYIKRKKSVETVLPWLYLKGISTGDFSEALAALLGKNPKGLSAGQSVASNNAGLMSMMAGVQETFRKRAMFISGQMAFISTSGVMMRNNAFWSSLV